MNKKGITLIVVILLMTLLAITALALTTFVVERLRFTTVRENEINAYYMAQGGVHYAIWKHRVDGTTNDTFDYADRGFTWETVANGDNLTITCTGYSPKTGTERIEKTLIANYNNGSTTLTGLRYGS